MTWQLKMVSLVLFIALLFLQYRLWFGESSVTEIREWKHKQAELASSNDKLQKTNEHLWQQIKQLRHHHDATEEKARRELGMIKKNETFYQFVE